ncbi:MAG: SDR family oxidoreductase [Verrucomicrobiae bacterium]|nr:SDR family oxidoreductase [Verrucomicrobiae bacterium]
MPDPCFLNHLFKLDDKRVLVMGGTGVLGRTIAAGFYSAGCRVAITSTRSEKGEQVGREIGLVAPRGMSLEVNALDRASLEKARDTLRRDWGGIDVLVNAVGGNDPRATVSPTGSFFSLDAKAIADVWQLNFLGGALLPIQVFGEMMQQQDNDVSIINISSMAALGALTRVVAYSAAKAAVDNLTRWLAVELARKHGRRFRVNAVAPGFFLTEQNRFLLVDEASGNLTERGQSVIAHTPVREFGKPEELQGACLWLASDAARFVTGVTIPVDGGFSAFGGV